MPFVKTRSENQCSICRHVKLPSDFYMGMKRGYLVQLSRCKPCSKEANRLDRAKRAGKIKAKALKNKEAIAEYQKSYRKKNSIKLSEFYRKRYLERKKDPSYSEKVRKYAARARELNPLKKVKDSLSSRLSSALKQAGASKDYRRTLDFVGCSIEDLCAHIESQFAHGMTWENRGKFGWHVDHIMPVSAFDHSKPEQVRQCWHFTNLRPMWWRDNLSKGKKITRPQMSLTL